MLYICRAEPTAGRPERASIVASREEATFSFILHDDDNQRIAGEVLPMLALRSDIRDTYGHRLSKTFVFTFPRPVFSVDVQPNRNHRLIMRSPNIDIRFFFHGLLSVSPAPERRSTDTAACLWLESTWSRRSEAKVMRAIISRMGYVVQDIVFYYNPVVE